jgi:hypothetical protein
MAVDDPFTITYNGQAVGGSSDTYLLNGPYVIDKSYRGLRVVFDVVVTAASYAALQSACDTLETKFRERDKNLVIDLSGNNWTYTAGTDYFNPVATLTKSGDPETDRGFSRAYTLVIEAELPSDDDGTGLVDVKTHVSFAPSRQRTVSFEGTYSAIDNTTDSEAAYLADGDTRCTDILTALDATATWELVEEDYDVDRNSANTAFTRQYVELLFNQESGNLDAAALKDHRVIFTDLSQHPAASREGIQVLRRVVGSYEAHLDIEVGTDLYTVFENTIRPHVVSTFETNFSPVVFCLEDRRISYDETSKRISAPLQFLYQKTGGDAVIEVSQSVAYRENRTIDYTPVHNGSSEATFYADLGWATIERVWTRSLVVLGQETPQRRIAGEVARYNEAGDFDNLGSLRIQGGREVALSGWNIVSNVSQVEPRWMGDPTTEEQISVTAMTETVVERYNDFPTRGPGRPTT